MIIPSIVIKEYKLERLPPITLIKANSYLRSLIDFNNTKNILIADIIPINAANHCNICLPDPIIEYNLLISIAGEAACISVFSLIDLGILNAWKFVLFRNLISNVVISL